MSGLELTDGLHDIPAGKVAAVVTHLEMTAPAPARKGPVPPGTVLTRVETPTPAFYRDLIYRVGGFPWLWFSRLALSDAALSRIIHDPSCPLYTIERNGRAEAMLELDFRTEGDCEMAFFGVSPVLIGTGAGRFLMNEAIRLAWQRPIRRLHLHTCTLDSPGALAFYIRSGFIPTRQQVEIADDPRLSGVLPREAGPHVPVFETAAR